MIGQPRPLCPKCGSRWQTYSQPLPLLEVSGSVLPRAIEAVDLPEITCDSGHTFKVQSATQDEAGDVTIELLGQDESHGQ